MSPDVLRREAGMGRPSEVNVCQPCYHDHARSTAAKLTSFYFSCHDEQFFDTWQADSSARSGLCGVVLPPVRLASPSPHRRSSHKLRIHVVCPAICPVSWWGVAQGTKRPLLRHRAGSDKPSSICRPAPSERWNGIVWPNLRLPPPGPFCVFHSSR